MAQLKGFVTHIIYRNNGNGYTVFELNTGDEITCVGTFQSLEEGEILAPGRSKESALRWRRGL